MMAVAAVALAVGGGMLRGVDREFYVLLATAAPVASLAVAGAAQRLARLRRRRRR